MNSVKLYSSGTAVLVREYPLDGAARTIAIPVRKSDLADVVASLAVFGDVTLPAPPSYSPVNAVTTPLQIGAATALRDLATKLAGARVRVERAGGAAVEGRLAGVHQYNAFLGGEMAERLRVVVLTDAGIVTVDEDQVTALRFLDDAVRAEVTKALDRSLGSIRPDSTTVELTVVPNAGATAVAISYAVPVAAWKIRYHLRLADAGTASLEGQAVVDNDTDDDWTDAVLSVVTGEPITFDTDLAETRRPKRSRVNVVADSATGAVVVAAAIPAMPPRPAPAPPMAMKDIVRDAARAAPESVESYLMEFPTERPQAEVRESGDFTVYTSPGPVSVGAKKSAIVPMFTTALGHAAEVLVYKEASDARRPFRAVKLLNDTPGGWGKGVAEVFRAGDFQGKGILEPCKPGEEAFLVYAKETGVRVHREARPEEGRQVSVRVREGAVTTEYARRAETEYRVGNARPERFALEIEHPRRLPNSEIRVEAGETAVTVVETPSGWRIGAELPASGTLAVAVSESALDEVEQFLESHENPIGWLLWNVVKPSSSRHPLAGNADIRAVIRLHEAAGEVQTQIREAEQQHAALEKAQERLLKLIPAAHPDQANAWRTELGTNETEMRELTKTRLPALKRELKSAQRKVRAAAEKLTVSWAEEGR